MSIRKGNSIIAGNPTLDSVVTTNTAQTITGNKSFTGTVQVPTSSADVDTSTEAVNVKYLYDEGYSALRSNTANIDLSNLSNTGNAHFQAPLVSGTNIKTINGNSILGSGDLTVSGGANPSLSNLNATGEAHFAKPDFSNATKPYVIETYHSGATWHIVFSDGFKMQGGVIGSLGASASVTVYFSKPFSETNYFCCPSWKSISYGGVGWIGRTTTGMTIQNAAGGETTIYWMACGY